MADVYFSRGNKLLPTTDKSVVRIFNLPAISIRNSLGNIDKSRPNICIEAPGICKEICYAYKRQSGNEKIVYGAMKANPQITIVEIVQKARISRRTVERIIARLKEKELIEKYTEIVKDNKSM